MLLPSTPTLALVSLLIITGCSQHIAEGVYVDATCAPCNQAPLQALQLPNGISLPPEAEIYKIPQPPKLAAVEQLDIRPPIQPLALLPSSEAYYLDQQVIHQLSVQTDINNLWEQLTQQLIQQKVGLSRSTKTSLTTDWIVLEDRDVCLKTRFHLSLLDKNRSPQLMGRLLDAQYLPKTADASSQASQSAKLTHPDQQPKLSDYQRRHYTILWVNRLLTELVSHTPQTSDDPSSSNGTKTPTTSVEIMQPSSHHL
ncbi:MAG: outer membrane protein assembly factor BamC [Candidatus Symbiodolus clandestinus]